MTAAAVTRWTGIGIMTGTVGTGATGTAESARRTAGRTCGLEVGTSTVNGDVTSNNTRPAFVFTARFAVWLPGRKSLLCLQGTQVLSRTPAQFVNTGMTPLAHHQRLRAPVHKACHRATSSHPKAPCAPALAVARARAQAWLLLAMLTYSRCKAATTTIRIAGLCSCRAMNRRQYVDAQSQLRMAERSKLKQRVSLEAALRRREPRGCTLSPSIEGGRSVARGIGEGHARQASCLARERVVGCQMSTWPLLVSTAAPWSNFADDAVRSRWGAQ
jgi:hypothetical protein